MSSKPPPPGWWQASDGKWYPPKSKASPRVEHLPPPSATEEPAKKPSGCLLAIFGALLLVVVVVIAGRGGGNNEHSEADASAQLACRHFRNVAADYSAGLLTMTELRGKLQEVNDDASVSQEPGIASSARGMLAAITAGDDAALATQVIAMSRACDQAGV
jgi:hypothetical protein